MVTRASRARRGIGVVLLVLGLLVAGRVAWVGVADPPDERPVAAQVAFLTGALDDGAAPRMQTLFPEGEFFMHVLTGLAAAPDDPALAREQLAAAEQPMVTNRFGSGLTPEHGTFVAGWTLALAVVIAETTGIEADLLAVDTRAPVLLDALLASPTGVPASYPGGYWPCDALVAAGAIARAAEMLGEQGWLDGLAEWRARVSGLIDEPSGLLPHRIDVTGATLDPPRGSSQSIIQAFWPDVSTALDGEPDRDSWLAFRAAFVVSVAGVVGVREHPVGTTGGSDVDSGPLLAGVSLSASAVTLAAARANGDAALAADLDREAELFGMPVELAGERRYAFGAVPVGDAFLAWSRSVPVAADTHEAGVRLRWPVLLLPGLLLVTVGALLLRRRASS